MDDFDPIYKGRIKHLMQHIILPQFFACLSCLVYDLKHMSYVLLFTALVVPWCLSFNVVFLGKHRVHTFDLRSSP